MATAPKRKKLDKTVELPPSKQKFYCCTCGTAYSQQKGNFSVSHSPMYRGTKYLAICQECVDSMFQRYRKELGGDRPAMRRVCMKLDLYWNDAIANMVENKQNVKSYVRSYIGKSNINSYISKTFDDTIREEGGVLEPVPVTKRVTPVKEEPMEVSEDLVDFWGPDYAPKDYLALEKRRQYLMKKYPKDYEFDTGEEILLRQLAQLEVEINRDTAAGIAVDKKRALLISTIDSANLKPSQKKVEVNDNKLEGMPLGVGLQKWEYYRPLPPVPEEMKDVNGLVRNINTWFLGHLSKMLGLKNSHCTLYERAMEKLRCKVEGFEDEDDDTFLANVLGGDEDDDIEDDIGEDIEGNIEDGDDE